MAAGTRLMLRLYLPPALLALGGFAIAEVLLQVAAYAGVPAANSALRVARAALDGMRRQ